MNSAKVVIEQPHFFPWCGYMGLLLMSDIFVFYDDIQFERRSWQSRNRIISGNSEWIYINASTAKMARDTLLKDIPMIKEEMWKHELEKKLKYEYGKTKYYNEYISKIMDIVMKDYTYLSDFNISIIRLLSDLLDFPEKKYIRSSEIDGVEGTKSDRLISIMKALDETVYLTSTGAKGYIETEKFESNGIELIWYEFTPKEYKQNHASFVSHLSVVDALFNIGKDETRKYIESIATLSMYR